ncbi:hypothetical protein CSOJ01_09635 [Colletotrichum sojae]|uniref:Heterokaryon incompatibility domain-containing protein n=1 Tax=Colletotrichum sojae TaxID=2175907 RepID=A0A8H6J2G3_9PEZI|nr:hypothetical protein CSOJ01_09635 [Colletotrichum sojae]
MTSQNDFLFKMTTSATSTSTSKAVDHGPGMDYDLDGSFPSFGSEAFDQIKDLYSLNQYRARSEAWAFKDIKFLIFDNSDEIQKPQEPPSTPGSGYDSNDEESTLRYAIKLSKESADTGQGKPEAGSSNSSDEKQGFKRVATEAGPSKPAKQRYLGKQPEKEEKKTSPCKVCSALPEFPHDRQPRKLRLFRPWDTLDLNVRPQPPPCIHCVPLSYCWPSRPKDSKGKLVPVEGSYVIRELDGSIRRNRALDEVLDRAVDFAQTCGLRMIWVDQECLPQADEDDREIALQAMDIVYN